ncbi:hypothetical protein [Streptomyces showdoensis]|uniref:hypothetical protein n=1 Tax=Streptomyces showdoensis TaxID=68268 RepID=UPI00103F0977|nr:hypothetical protein [Streptomyces showdoensis]
MTVDWRKTRRPAISFAVFGALAFVFGADVPLLWRLVLVASAAASVIATSVEPATIRLVKPTRIPTQNTGT